MCESNTAMWTQVLSCLLVANRMERQRVCDVLHDEVGQTLSAVGLQLELLRMDFEGRAPDISCRTTSIQKLLDGALTPLRDLVSQIDPAPRTRAHTERAPDE
jgi:signal transduction histidine kinase